ncbi:unnamed protein product [Orchesella dallaii]|uniref:Rad60/SUMO-like domain-containing protein n=1 Tax=Orchesella dallaii TaxID=48710 RepID=A0ABP1R592_9HEXA
MANTFESDDDDDFYTPSVADFSNMFSSIQQQVRKEAASSCLQSKPISNTNRITTAKSSSKLLKKTKLDDAPKTKSSTSLSPNTFKKEGAEAAGVSDDLHDLIAQANKIIVEAPPAPSSSSQNGMAESKYASKRKIPSSSSAVSKPKKAHSSTPSTAKAAPMTVDSMISSSISAAVAAAASASSKRRGRPPKSKGGGGTASTSSFTSALDLGTVVQNGKRRSTRKDKKRVPEVLSLVVSSDEDEEVVEGVDVSLNFAQNESLMDEVEENVVENMYTVRINWKDEILRFTVPNGTKVSKIRMDIADTVSVRADNLVVLEGEGREVSDNTLVQNLPFGILDVFERKPIFVTNNNNSKSKKVDPDCIQVKVQGCGGYRERLIVFIKKTTHIKQLIDDFVEKYGYHDKHFKLVFDGDTVDLSETAESLDLDGGEMFDIVEVK